MKINCPKCGVAIKINTGGRKRLNKPFKLVSEVLRACQNVDLATKELGCSVGYIYQELNKKGLKPRDVMSRSEAGRLGGKCKKIEQEVKSYGGSE